MGESMGQIVECESQQMRFEWEEPSTCGKAASTSRHAALSRSGSNSKISSLTCGHGLDLLSALCRDLSAQNTGAASAPDAHLYRALTVSAEQRSERADACRFLAGQPAEERACGCALSQRVAKEAGCARQHRLQLALQLWNPRFQLGQSLGPPRPLAHRSARRCAPKPEREG
eukprot:scaffold147818_cov27-Tisochrysis_lutea.AAC.6